MKPKQKVLPEFIVVVSLTYVVVFGAPVRCLLVPLGRQMRNRICCSELIETMMRLVVIVEIMRMFDSEM